MQFNLSVDPPRVGVLGRLIKGREDHNDLAKAHETLGQVEQSWNLTREIVLESLRLLNPQAVSNPINVCVFPVDFFVGAVEVIDQLILYGQPLRTPAFPSAVIAHETCHILLSKLEKQPSKIVNETACFLTEQFVFRLAEKKTLRDIWQISELDEFHEAAFHLACRFDEELLDGRAMSLELLPELTAKTPVEIMKLEPPKGLLKNLRILTKGI